MTYSASTSPAVIDVDRAAAITVTWEDGHVSRYALLALRKACPCAGCRVAWRQDEERPVPDDVSIVDVKLAGAWGMTPTWSDGHHTGIYSWEDLRAACPCDVCTNPDVEDGASSGETSGA
jgi:DUF971 family protein